jgi:hypothetical protein
MFMTHNGGGEAGVGGVRGGGYVGVVGCVGCVGGEGCGMCGVCGVCGVCVGVWGGGGVGVWGVGVWVVWACGVTPYVRHSTECTCCDFGHLQFFKVNFEHLCTVCVLPYSSFIIALKTIKLGMYTLLGKRKTYLAICNKKS